MVVFSFEDRGEKRVIVGSHVPSNMGEETFIDSLQVSNSYASIFLGLANVFPGPKSNEGGGIIILDPSPPK